ncbi:deoxyribose-phosphate aldolase [Micrococcales bacterium 31B]|nr:deoxyribose-phosphate aldolase [Micrococcales bacterium 31B]
MNFVNTYDELMEVRATQPERITELLASRRRRPFVGEDGKLMLVAADHPARGALAVGANPTAMADRFDLLDRMRAALANPGVDGVLATSEILEDLLLLGALEDKVVVASMNRGGLAGSSFELDDRLTGADVRDVVDSRWDSLKMLTRIDLADEGTVKTLELCARVVNECNREKVIAMVEPFMSSRVATEGGSKVTNDLSLEAVQKSIAIASGLAGSSAYTWLKLPAIPNMAEVMRATTLPALLLGGDPVGEDPEVTRERWSQALAIPQVRGLVVGRTLLYPHDDDVQAAVAHAVALIGR